VNAAGGLDAASHRSLAVFAKDVGHSRWAFVEQVKTTDRLLDFDPSVYVEATTPATSADHALVRVGGPSRRCE
jgi:hypothetical protein